MYNFLFVLTCLGYARCYHNHGSHPYIYPSHTPTEMTWNQPSKGYSHQWNYQDQWQYKFGWFNPSGIYEPSYSYDHGQNNGQTANGASQSFPNPPSNSQNTYDPSQSNGQSANGPGQSFPNPPQDSQNAFKPGQSNAHEPSQNAYDPSQSKGQNANEPGPGQSYYTSPSNSHNAFISSQSNANEPGQNAYDHSQNDNRPGQIYPKPPSNSQNAFKPGQNTYNPSQSNGQNDNRPSQSHPAPNNSQNAFNPGQSNVHQFRPYVPGDSYKLSPPNLSNSNGKYQSSQEDRPLNYDDYVPPNLNHFGSSRVNATGDLNATNASGKVDNTEAKRNETIKKVVQKVRKDPPTTPYPATMSEPVPALGQLQAPSLQWHVAIYTKTFTPYRQICGGSLVKSDVVLSAAHCFWSDDGGLQRPALYAVGAGKLQRAWDSSADVFAQQSDIRELKVPPRFQGAKTSFQDDLAVARLSSPLEYAPGVKPICVDFELMLDRKQLEPGSRGTIAGWGLTDINGPPSERLNFLKLPYVQIESCIRAAAPGFIKYITSDKICAGDQWSGHALCRGDSGGGLVYYSGSTPYLRGVASTAPRDDNECNAYAVATFTHIRSHMTFLADHVPDIAEGCRALYETEKRNDTDNMKILPGTSGQPLSTGANSSIPTPMKLETRPVKVEELMGNRVSNVAKVPENGPALLNAASDKKNERNSNVLSMDKGSKVLGNTTTFECNCYCKKC